MLMQSIQLFEKCEHEHLICKSEKEQHFHQNNYDDCCSHLNFHFEVFSSDISNDFVVLPTHYFTNQYNEKPQIVSDFHYTTQTDRGPPTA